MQDLYQTIARELSDVKDGSCIKAATDDVLVVHKASMKKNFAPKQCLWFSQGAAKIGLSITKRSYFFRRIWLPRIDLLPPSIGLRSNTFENVKLRGMEIVGASVGAPDFC